MLAHERCLEATRGKGPFPPLSPVNFVDNRAIQNDAHASRKLILRKRMLALTRDASVLMTFLLWNFLEKKEGNSN